MNAFTTSTDPESVRRLVTAIHRAMLQEVTLDTTPSDIYSAHLTALAHTIVSLVEFGVDAESLKAGVHRLLPFCDGLGTFTTEKIH